MTSLARSPSAASILKAPPTPPGFTPPGRHRDRAQAKSARATLRLAKALTEKYGRQLRKIARHIDDIVRGFDAGSEAGRRAIQAHLQRYSATLAPWAEANADRMLAEVAAADGKRWRRLSAEIGRGIEREIQSAPVADAFARMKADQVRLITSLPSEAAERVHSLVVEGLSKGVRSDEIAAQIYETGSVSRSRADLIARTEVSRAATTFQMSRAQHVGSPGYIWRTSEDSDVRHDHRLLAGKVFRWDDPPVADRRTGAKAHPGCIYRCRCYAETLLPD